MIRFTIKFIAFFTLGVLAAMVGYFVVCFESPSFNPADWHPVTRGLTYIWAIACVVISWPGPPTYTEVVRRALR